MRLKTANKTTLKMGETGTLTGRDAILVVGKHLHKDFSLDDPDINKSYQMVYEAFVRGLNYNDRPKSVLLIGAVGCGKTMCMRVMHKLLRDSPRKFMWKRGRDLKDFFEENNLSQLKKEYGYDLKSDLYIDDIGFLDSEIKKYGNKTNPIGELLLDRYDLYTQEGYLTHMSSNMLGESDDGSLSLSSVFGDRCYDRIKEMTAEIIFVNDSMRK